MIYKLVLTIRGDEKVEVSLNIKVDAATFYKFLISHLEEDIKASNGQDIEPHAGYEYTKKFNRMVTKTGVNTKCLVSDLVENSIYELKIISNVETTTIRYEIEDHKDSINVSYTEDTVSDSKRVALNYKIFRFAHSVLIGKRKMKKKLKQIELYLQKEY